MRVILYNTPSPPQKVIKDLKNETEFHNVVFFEDNSLDVLEPSILIDNGQYVTDINKFNYVYIPQNARYYYITKISTEGQLARIDCKVDVLMSWHKDIYNSSQYVARSQNKQNRLLVDNLLPVHSDHTIEFCNIGTRKIYDESCNCLILETAGKGERQNE